MDTPSNYDLSIHTNPDAQVWAKFFMKTLSEVHKREGFVIDEAYMTAWFANAMMAMHDHLVLNGNPINGDHAACMLEHMDYEKEKVRDLSGESD